MPVAATALGLGLIRQTGDRLHIGEPRNADRGYTAGRIHLSQIDRLPHRIDERPREAGQLRLEGEQLEPIAEGERCRRPKRAGQSETCTGIASLMLA